MSKEKFLMSVVGKFFLENFLAVLTVVGETIWEVCLAVHTVVGRNILELVSRSIEKVVNRIRGQIEQGVESNRGTNRIFVGLLLKHRAQGQSNKGSIE